MELPMLIKKNFLFGLLLSLQILSLTAMQVNNPDYENFLAINTNNAGFLALIRQTITMAAENQDVINKNANLSSTKYKQFLNKADYLYEDTKIVYENEDQK